MHCVVVFFKLQYHKYVTQHVMLSIDSIKQGMNTSRLITPQ